MPANYRIVATLNEHSEKPLGPPDVLRRTLDRYFPGIYWRAWDLGSKLEGDTRINFELRERPVTAIWVRAFSVDPTLRLIAMGREHGWYAVRHGSNELLESERPVGDAEIEALTQELATEYEAEDRRAKAKRPPKIKVRMRGTEIRKSLQSARLVLLPENSVTEDVFEEYCIFEDDHDLYSQTNRHPHHNRSEVHCPDKRRFAVLELSADAPPRSEEILGEFFRTLHKVTGRITDGKLVVSDGSTYKLEDCVLIRRASRRRPR